VGSVSERDEHLGSTARLMLKLGVLAFGGPAAHIGMLEEEVVERRRWMSRQHFLDLVGATNLIPGPNSTEMMMHVGFERAGWLGLMVAGTLFVLPAAVISGTLAALYQSYGSLPPVEPFLSGIKPAVLAVILAATIRLGRSALKTWRETLLGGVVVVAVLLGVNELLALFAGAILGCCWLLLGRRATPAAVVAVVPVLGQAGVPAAIASGAAAGTTPVSLVPLGLFFLKVGAVLYGSGYVLVAFLDGDLVRRLGWLTSDQLLDAIAIGQMTPGPVLSTATFIGYLLLGVPGAVVATTAIFLPSFAFVGLFNPVVPKLRRRRWSAAFLDAVNSAALALMAVVVLRLGAASLVSWQARMIAGLSVLAVFGFRVPSVWLIVGGALLGFALEAVPISLE
jgi:chromate transporter